MKKLLCLCLFLPAVLCGQEFFAPSYVYGVGMDWDECRADSLALFSFARSVGVRIVSNSEYRFEEAGNVYENNFKRESIIDSRLYVDGLKKKVEYDGGVFTVYYYINKDEYIQTRMSAYEKYLKMAREQQKNNNPHKFNLFIGYMYKAYCELNSELLNMLYPVSRERKESLYEEIRRSYMRLACKDGNMGEYYLAKRKYSDGLLLIRDENLSVLPDFEYYSFNGTWDAPHSYLNQRNEPCNRENAIITFVDNTNAVYRFVYEEILGGEIVKIPVPEEFYFCYFKFLG